VSFYPLPGHAPADDDDENQGCANCEHIAAAHYDGGCEICDDVDSDCPGFST
jgi:hypothetical protein